MPRISRLFAREVLDSRGRPTVEVEAWAGEICGRAIVPSGASTGKAEALELRDGDPQRYGGRGVLRAVDHVNSTLGPAILGMEPGDQAAIDARLLEVEGTPRKTRLGANAVLGASLAAAHLGGALAGLPLYEHFRRLYAASRATAGLTTELRARMPLPMTNMISGGLHAGGNLDFQDILVMPEGAPDYRTGLEWIVRVYEALGKRLAKQGYEGRLVGDEGGVGPKLGNNQEALRFVVDAIADAELEPGRDLTLALDVAATHFFEQGSYRLAAEKGKTLSSGAMIDVLESLCDKFPLKSIEDGLAEEDWEGWQELTKRLGSRVQIVGDDLLATNPQRLAQAVDRKVANAVLVKVNQVGTLTETFHTMRLAELSGYRRVISARSGETEDTTLADLAVGVAGDQIKIGSIVRSERLAKYNQLLRIEEQLGSGALRPPQ